jgi:hypothetical protein
MAAGGLRKEAFLLFALLIMNFSTCFAGTYSGGEDSNTERPQLSWRLFWRLEQALHPDR